MESHNKWKIKFSIIMVIAIIVIYGSNILILKDPEHVISYIWTHFGFIPVDILIVAFLLDEIISKKEKETMMEKLDMIMSTFFSEIGNDLIGQLSSVNQHKADTQYLESIKTWSDKDYENKLKEIKNIDIPFKSNVAPEDRE